jgi:hypothetical protein
MTPLQDQVYQPNQTNHSIYLELFSLFKEAYRSNRALLESLTSFNARENIEA